MMAIVTPTPINSPQILSLLLQHSSFGWRNVSSIWSSTLTIAPSRNPCVCYRTTNLSVPGFARSNQKNMRALWGLCQHDLWIWQLNNMCVHCDSFLHRSIFGVVSVWTRHPTTKFSPYQTWMWNSLPQSHFFNTTATQNFHRRGDKVWRFQMRRDNGWTFQRRQKHAFVHYYIIFFFLPRPLHLEIYPAESEICAQRKEKQSYYQKW